KGGFNLALPSGYSAPYMISQKGSHGGGSGGGSGGGGSMQQALKAAMPTIVLLPSAALLLTTMLYPPVYTPERSGVTTCNEEPSPATEDAVVFASRTPVS